MKPSINNFMLAGRITYISYKQTKTKEDMFMMGLSVPKRAWQIRGNTGGRATTNNISVSGFREMVPYAKKHLQKEDFIVVTGDVTSSAVRSSGKKKHFGMAIWLVVRTIKPLFRGDRVTPHPSMEEAFEGSQPLLERPQTAETDPLLADDLS
jgi:hypothetical protein